VHLFWDMGGISITKQSLGGSLETRSKIGIFGHSKKLKQCTPIVHP